MGGGVGDGRELLPDPISDTRFGGGGGGSSSLRSAIRLDVLRSDPAGRGGGGIASDAGRGASWGGCCRCWAGGACATTDAGWGAEVGAPLPYAAVMSCADPADERCWCMRAAAERSVGVVAWGGSSLRRRAIGRASRAAL
jgi:hypothetical protein